MEKTQNLLSTNIPVVESPRGSYNENGIGMAKIATFTIRELSRALGGFK